MIVSIFAPWTITGGGRKGERVPGVHPHRWETTWDEFVDVLRSSASLPTPRDHKATGNVRIEAMAMADYPLGANRSKAAALGADWIGLDIDDKDGTPGSWKFDGLAEYLDTAGVTHALYTTTSCTEEQHCLRLIMPFDRFVPAVEWPMVWAAFAAWIGQVDVNTKDLSRILYEPRLWEGAYNRFFATSSRPQFVNVDRVLATYAPLPTRSDAPPWMANAGFDEPELRSADNLTDFDLSPIIKAGMVEDALLSPTGGRMYRFVTRVALSARAQHIALTEGELADIGMGLARRMGRKDITDIRRDARRALEWADGVTFEPSSDDRLPPPWPWSRS
jgi:hypothetical protein